jgi:hypothetical protein
MVEYGEFAFRLWNRGANALQATNKYCLADIQIASIINLFQDLYRKQNHKLPMLLLPRFALS